MSGLWLTLEVAPGACVGDVCKEAVRLANFLGVCVWFNFNSVKCLARPGDDPERIYESWDRELTSNHTYKIASDRG